MNQNKLTNCKPTDEIVLLEDDSEDELLARALEESLRHYREVEIPFRQSQCLYQQSENGKPGRSQDDIACTSTTEHQVQTPLQPVLYEGKDAEGFDLAAGKTWIYPTNYPVRQYQYDIVNASLFRNTLVSLPTGLGKTFIAAVVMHNFYRWFPMGKVVFMAPTKPLVHQQIDSCYKVMGIPKEDTAELTGSMSPSERAVAWEKKRVFFLTPQVFTNDLTCGACVAASIKCLVVDEAHRALGNHSYCQVMKALLPFNNKFRVLALTATPGSNMQAVRQVVGNLMISHMELRKEESPDIAVFTHKRNIETVIVSLGTFLSSVRERFLLILDRYLVFLRMQKVLYGCMNSHTKFGILKARDMFRQKPPSHIPRGKTGIIEANFAVCITLLHALELLSLYGLRSFLKFLQGVLNGSRGTAVVLAYLKNENELQKLLDELQDKLGLDNQVEPDPDQSVAVVSLGIQKLLMEPPSGQELAPYEYSHPKVEKLQDIVVGHFRNFQEKNVATRAMIFCEYRDISDEVYHILQKHRPLVKPMTFVGQSSTGKQSKGFSQKQQLKVMRKFKAGGYNTLISTCVGEEGLDIGEVDLIVCFDAHKSPIRLVQRMGRTGRQREGRIVMLVTEGKELAKFKTSMYQNRTMSTKLLERNNIAPYMYANNPRMIPCGIEPVCHRMLITVPAVVKQEARKKKQRQQDIRKLLGEPSGCKVTGKKGNEGSLPYCTEEELVESWDGKTVPAFGRLKDVEELHAKMGSDLRQVFSVDCVTSKFDKPMILDLGKWLPWQQSLQPAVLVQHTDDSRMLIELLQYAANKRCQMQSTQTAGLLSQANSLKWRKKKTKGRYVPNKKVKSSASVHKCGGKKDPEVNEQFKNMAVTEGIPSSFKLQHQASATSFQIGAEVVDVESAEMLLTVPVPDHIDTAIAEQTPVSPKKDLNGDDLCYFCENGLFYCHHIISCIPTVTKTREETGHYKCLDLSIMYNFNEVNVTAFDLRQLLSPVTSPDNDPSCERACQIKSEKDRDIMKPNFNLDFSVFEQCLLEAERLLGGPTDNTIHSVAVAEVACEHQVTEVGQKVKYCAVSVNDNKYKSSDVLGIESTNDIVLPETEIRLPQKSHSDVSPGRFSSIAITPSRDLQVGTNHFHKQMPRNVLSPVSPILGSVLERHSSDSPVLHSVPIKNVPESPVLGALTKNLSHHQIKSLPICSTPKNHKKNLFWRNRMLDTVQEQEGDFTSVRAKDDRSLKTVAAGVCEQQLNSCAPVIQTPPRPNFDLFSATLWPGNSDPNVDSVNNMDTTMLTVTQLLGLVDKGLNTRVDIEDSALPCEPVKASKPLQACTDIVPASCSESQMTEYAALKNKYPGSVKPSNNSNITSLIGNSVEKVTSSCREQKSEHGSFYHDYLYDDADDIFANLSVDCHMFTSKERTSATCAVDNIPEAETCLPSKNKVSQHCEVACVYDTAGVATEVKKLPLSSAVVYSHLTSSVIRPSCSSLSLKHKLTDFANDTCMGISSVKTVRNIPKTSSSAVSETVNFYNKNSPSIRGDKKEYAEVFTTVTGKQKEFSGSVDFGGQPDFYVSLGKDSVATCIGSSSHSKTPVDEDSPIIKPLGRNKKRNVSSTSNESGVSSPCHPHNVLVKDERSRKCNSLLVKDCGWLTARSNSDTSLSSLLEDDDRDNPHVLSGKKRHNSPSGKRQLESCIAVRESDVAYTSSDDDFQSQSLIKWKKRSQGEGAGKPDRNGNQRKMNPVKRKLKHGLRHCAFVETEAEESGSCLSDDDDEDKDSSDLDNYDSSFVNDSGNQTYTDIQAKFLHSVIHSAGDQQGQFKMPSCKPTVPLEDVFSQEEPDFETSYLEDSFCVNEEPQSEVMEASALEEAEAVLEAESKWKRRKRKQMMFASDNGESDSENCLKSDSVTIKKRRRIVTLESSDSENNEEVNNVNITTTDKVQLQKEIVPPPKIHTGSGNTNSGSIYGAGNSETVFGCKKFASCESLSTKETEMVTVGDRPDWNDWNFDQVELPSCDPLIVDKDDKKSTFIRDKETESLFRKSVSTKWTETVTESDEWDWNDWNFDQVELPSCDQSFVKEDNKKYTSIFANETKEKGSVSTCSTKLIPKAVRSLSAEFNKERVPTSLSGDRDTRKLPLVEDGNSVLLPSDSSSAELTKELQLESNSTTVLEACSSSSKTIIMATRQVASAPEIATILRAVHKINVLVRSVTEADYVISWQLAVLRVRMSDFIRTCPIKSGLAKAVKLLRSGFMKHVLVAENDKLAPVPAWHDVCSKVPPKHVAYLRQAGIPVLYSCDKAETARLLALLTDMECSHNRGIVSLPKDAGSLLHRIQFYQSLPGVNIALATRLCHMFSSIIDFLDRCSSVQKIQEVLGLDAEKAVRIQLVLHHVLKPQC